MVYELLGLRDREYDKFSFVGSETVINIGSQAGMYTILCGKSGTSIIPLLCDTAGHLLTASGA